MGWGRWMGGRFTLLLSLCSLPVCLNLPTTTHPLITCYCLHPPSLTVYFSSLHLSTPPPLLQLSIYPSIVHNCITFFQTLTYFLFLTRPFYHPIKSCLSLVRHSLPDLEANADFKLWHHVRKMNNMTYISINKRIVLCWIGMQQLFVNTLLSLSEVLCYFQTSDLLNRVSPLKRKECLRGKDVSNV